MENTAESIDPEQKKQILNLIRENREEDLRDIAKRKIRTDNSKKDNYVKIWNRAVNIGTASELLYAQMQNQLKILHDDLEIKYVRMFNIFGRDMYVLKDRGMKKLNFEVVDHVLDYVLSLGMKPVIDFGDKPDRVFLDSESSMLAIDEYEPLFQSAHEYRNLVEKFCTHIQERYGQEEVDGNVPLIDDIMPFEVKPEQYELYKAVFLDNPVYSQEETEALVNGTYEDFINAVYSYNLEERAAAKVKDGTIDKSLVEAAGISID